MRVTVLHGNIYEAAVIWLLAFVVLAFMSVARVHPNAFFPLTKEYIVLGSVVLVSHIGLVLVFGSIGTALGLPYTWNRLVLAWSYTMIPTMTWFLATLILAISLPPPRSFTLLGSLGSTLFLVGSGVLLLWKMTLVYIAFRYVFRIGLGKILVFFCVIAPIITTYIIATYRMGIFRVPFL